MTPNASDVCAYLPDENIWFVGIFANERFPTVEKVRAAFAECRKFWHAHIHQRCYTAVDYTHTEIDKAVADTFAAERQRIVSELTLVTVRYTADLTARTAIRAMSIKIHQPSNLYQSRDEALTVLRRIRDGQITVAAD